MEKKLIVFLATAWGPKHGGINSFNRDLCVALAKILPDNYQIVCVVKESVQDDIDDSAKNKVLLIPLDATETKSFEKNRAYEVASKIDQCQSGKVSWWIGHDVITGFAALGCRDVSKSGKCAVIHHMNYQAYSSYKGSDTRKKIEEQTDVLSRADLVFAVGPKLATSAREKTRAANVRTVELIPGLADIKGLPMPSLFSAITLGRLDLENDRVKQPRLAVAAFGAALNSKGLPQSLLGTDASLTVIGLSKDNQNTEHQELMKLAEERAYRAVPVHGWPYMENPKGLLEHLRSHSVCLMLSLHEGFGLVAWEAIAAEVPLIISRNSGVYEYINNLLEGNWGSGCFEAVDIHGSISGPESFEEQDVESVKIKLLEIKNLGDKAKRNAHKLKNDLLVHGCIWENTAVKMAEACELVVSRAIDAPEKSENAHEEETSHPIQNSQTVMTENSLPQELSVLERRALVNALLGCEYMRKDKLRTLVLKDLPDEIYDRISFSSDANNLVCVTDIVQTCLNFPNGLTALINAVYYYEKNAACVEKLNKVIGRILTKHY
ncbi:MAG: glycosyltransferase [Gammaproteobacteria bacterium]|nr:glycosyltransferase [Gammaproteobacteria bacterium]